MTKEEVIRVLNESRETLIKASFWEATKMQINECFDTAIRALEQYPCKPDITEEVKEQALNCAVELLKLVAMISKGEKNGTID